MRGTGLGPKFGPMSHDASGPREPAINLPGLILAAIVILMAIHAGREWLLDPKADLEFLFDAGFVPARWSLLFGFASVEEIVREATNGVTDADSVAAGTALAEYVAASPGAGLLTAVSYALLHGSWMHVVLNCVWLAAFGTPVLRRCGAARFLILALLATIGAVLAHWLLNALSWQVVIGASGTVSGFMGAAALFVFERPAPARSWPPDPPRRSSVLGLLRNRSALLFLGTWFGINLLVGFLSQPLGLAEGGIAWQAHIGGLLTGLLAFPYLDPVGDPRDDRPA
ncbi:MAG: rhomboid family intrarane serine protease [Enterovirga sp.]|nr:rhomboid family intrarane serine protease [Enterovirga sp.]